MTDQFDDKKKELCEWLTNEISNLIHASYEKGTHVEMVCASLFFGGISLAYHCSVSKETLKEKFNYFVDITYAIKKEVVDEKQTL